MLQKALIRSAFFLCIIGSLFYQILAQFTVSNIQQYQVIQRTAGTDFAVFSASGTCRNNTSKIQVQLLKQSNSQVVESFTWKELTDISVNGTSWKGTVNGLPAGGEYKIQFKALNGSGTAIDSISPIQNILVGDIWLCAGQSNLMGQPGSTVQTSMVHTRILWNSQPGTGDNSKWGTTAANGPSTSFGNKLSSLTGVPIGIVWGAQGGTGLTDWFYKSNNIFSSLKKYIDAGVTWNIGGFMWYQGENEDQQDTWATRYLVKFGKMRDSIRSLSKNPKLPVLVVQLESWDGVKDYPLDPYSRWIRWPIIRDQQELAGRELYSACATIWPAPGIHIDGTNEALLGTYLAAAACKKFYADKAPDPGAGPHFKQAWFEDATRQKIVVQFDGVKGCLSNPADPNHLGFYVMKPSVFNINDSTIFAYEKDSRGNPAKMLLEISSMTTSGTDKVILTLAKAPTDSVTVGYGRHIQLVSLAPLTDNSKIPVCTFFNRPILTSPPLVSENVIGYNYAGSKMTIVKSKSLFFNPENMRIEIGFFRPDGRLIQKSIITGSSLDLHSLRYNGLLLIKCKIGDCELTSHVNCF
jgi:hypothetical protein